ncbi:hypothetical protein KUCAC02_019966 [Chaenocephalus aceratus]|uniref:Uncharacterized protein n=1 Tax=Chaenocephalus aceratus TaxID=36190 RepID=A0ACB9VQP9_CHAAC|nr:hypothetical protein KUCAC02_019966 [Chaenocephalus aceratus]
MAGVCLSVTSHLTPWRMETLGDASKRNLALAAGPLIIGGSCRQPQLPLKTPSRTNHHKKPWRLSITTLDYLQFFLLETMGLSSPSYVETMDCREQHYRTHGSLYSRRNFCYTRPQSFSGRSPSEVYWPKSRCFDYLYQDAEMLLRNYPVQATICLYADSSSDEDSDDDDDEEEEEMEKELN